MEWLTYLLKVSVCTALFFAFYHFFLRKLTFFSGNRVYLLITMMLSLLIPALQLEIDREDVPFTENLMTVTREAVDITSGLPMSQKVTYPDTGIYFNYSWVMVIFTIYWMVVTILFFRFFLDILKVLVHVRKADVQIDGLNVIYKSGGFTNCSFLSYVFVNKWDLTNEEIATIVRHEGVHASRYHTVDKLLFSLCRILLWFNPIVYLYDKELELVHEYEADRDTSSLVGNVCYANQLLSLSARKGKLNVIHSFAEKAAKQRIIMLFTNQSKNMKKLTYLAGLPLLMLLFWCFSTDYVIAQNVKKPEGGTVHDEELAKQERRLVKNGEFYLFDRSFAERRIDKDKNGDAVYRYEVNLPNGNQLWVTGDQNLRPQFLIRGKVYSFEQAQKFDQGFILSLGNSYSTGPVRASKFPGLNTGGWLFHFAPQEELNSKLGYNYWDPKNASVEQETKQLKKTTRAEAEKLFSKGHAELSSTESTYSAQDSITINEEHNEFHLYGNATFKNEHFDILADEIRLESKGFVAYAKNVSFKKNSLGVIKSPYAMFNLHEGTYKLIDQTDKF